MEFYHKTAKVLAAVLTVAVSWGCTANYENINRNPYQPSLEDMGADSYLFGAMIRNLQDLMMPEQENFSQYVDCLMPGSFSGYVADSNTGAGWSGRFATYNPSDNWLQVPFQDFYTKFYPNYFQLKGQSEDELYLALSELFRVTVMARVTDTYGPIPYSHVGAENALNSPYDSQQEVYRQMFESLNRIIDVLTQNRMKSIAAGSDRIYGGNIEKWAKFANTVKLRLAIRVVYADGTLAQSKAEEAVNSEAGIIAEVADGALRAVSDHNPWERFMPNWSDARIAADLTCYMNGYNDPRRPVYYGMTTFSQLDSKVLEQFPELADIPEAYNGLRRGIEQGSYHAAAHGYSCMNISTTDPIRILPASEAAFLCAEGALRGWNMQGTDAKTWYERGIRLSFAERGVSGADEYIADSDSRPAAYTDPITGAHAGLDGTTGSTVTIAWDDGATFEENLERIITQKWIAIFPNCMEAWSEYRRTGYPKLMPAVNNLSNGVVSDSEGCRRLPYPMAEYRENGVNVNAAVSNLSQESASGVGDNMATHVWWDCNPRINRE